MVLRSLPSVEARLPATATTMSPSELPVTLATHGSWGDVRPFLLLGRELRRAGHPVTFLGQPEFATAAERAGLEHVAAQSTVPRDSHHRLTRTLLRATDRLEQLDALVSEVVLRDLDRQVESSERVLAGSRLLVAHHMALVPSLVATSLGVTRVSVFLCPGLVPSSGPPLELESRGAARNRLAWAVARARVRKRVEPRARAALAPLLAGGSTFRIEDTLSPTLNLVAASPALCHPDAKRWDAPVEVTGQWHASTGGALPEELAAWLGEGPPPVLATFGSMAAGRGEALGRILRDATSSVGARLLLQRGWAELEAGPPDRTLAYAGPLDHEILFPRAVAVVHHAGAGTTHAVARAGRPSVPVPCLIDQPYWGDRLWRLGCASRPVPLADLSADRLALALGGILDDPEIEAGCRSLAGRIAADDGLARAVEALAPHLDASR